MNDPDTLERQWRDHVNDGLVVRWIRSLVLRVRRWRVPPTQVVLLVRPLRGLGQGPIAPDTLIVRVSLHPGQERTVRMPYPIAVHSDEVVVVALQELVVATPAFVALEWTER